MIRLISLCLNAMLLFVYSLVYFKLLSYFLIKVVLHYKFYCNLAF